MAILAVMLTTIAFSVNLFIALQFEKTGALDQYDVFFDADTIAGMECMVKNQCGGRSSFSHPNLALFLNPPLQASAWALKQVGILDRDEAALRRALALLVCPFASTLKVLAVFGVLLLLGLASGQAFLLSLLCIVSFSQIIFGSIPESFALSGLLLAAAHLFAIYEMRSERQRFWPWVVLGVLTAGIAVTNLVVVVILFVVARLYLNVRTRLVVSHAVLLSVLIVLPTVLLPSLFRNTYHLIEVDTRGGITYTKRWMKTEYAADRALETPATWAHTFAAPKPYIGTNSRAIREQSKYPYRFTLSPAKVFSSYDPLTLLILLLLVAGAISHIKAPRMAKWMAGASLCVVAFNWVLHSIWGVELFLYSQHWHLTLLILLAGLFLRERPRMRALTLAAVVVLILLVIVQNAATISAILAELHSAPPEL